MSRSRTLYICALIIGWLGLWFGRQFPQPASVKEVPRSPASISISPTSAAEAKESLPPIEVEKIR